MENVRLIHTAQGGGQQESVQAMPHFVSEFPCLSVANVRFPLHADVCSAGVTNALVAL